MEVARAVVIDGPGVTVDEVVAVARRGAPVELSPAALARMAASRAIVDRVAASDLAVYGVSTGFGALAGTAIAPEQRSQMQHAILRSHAAGMGPAMAGEVVRAMIMLRIRTLALGYSGVRPLLAELLASVLNAGITPIVPTHGSLGASGDLAPLAHASLCLIGEGEVIGPDGRRLDAARALAGAGLAPVRLEAKEGLALINGTDGMLAMLCLACHDTLNLLRVADVAAAMSIEALLGTDRPFAEVLQAIRPHPGQLASAANLTRLLAGSAIKGSHRHSDHAVQDSYSMRCSPQVAGAARDTLDFALAVAGRELESVTDNPVVLPSGEVESTGNFHGEPLAFACDFLAIAAAEVGAISERRIDRMLDPHRSAGLPPFLAPDAGVNSGLMIAQYTAAGLVAENRRLATPASVDSIPTSGMQEDHVSMGWGAAVKLRAVLENVARILAVELVCAARGLDLRQPLAPGPATGGVRDLVREHVAGPGPDRQLAPELAAVEGLVIAGEVLARAQDHAGPLR